MKKIAIYCSNLFCGGGLQVAVSTIIEFSKLDISKQIDVYCSSVVYSILEPNKDIFENFNTVFISDDKPLRSMLSFKNYKYYDVWFSIFGPVYISPNAKHHICGFAQPWIAYPNNEVYKKYSYFTAFKTKIKFLIQKELFKRYSSLIVEAEHVKRALVSQGFEFDSIHVVNNAVSSLYINGDEVMEYEPYDVIESKHDILLGFVGRNYLHKNLGILKDVSSILEHKYKANVGFIFTLTNDEMKDLGFDSLEGFYTVGEITPSECKRFYHNIDALIFPSLLECYSASPIEAMYMNTPVLCSERKFLSGVCKDNAIYFNPTSSENIADVIYGLHNNNYDLNEIVKSAKKMVLEIPSAQDRARNYKNIIESLL